VNKLSFTILFLLQSVWAFEIPLECENQFQNEAVNCNQKNLLIDPKLDELDRQLKPLATYSFLNEKLSKLIKANNVLKGLLAQQVLALQRGIPETPELKATRKDIKKIRADFDKLNILSQEAIVLQKKFNICINNC
jgi:hypothetical protein